MVKVQRHSGLALTVGGVALAFTFLAGAPAVSAKSGDIVRRGDCTRSTDWKLKLSPEDGRIEVEFEVDSNRNGQTWDVVLRDNGSVVARGTRKTAAPSGSFEFRRVIGNRAGADKVTAVATNRTTSETCRGAATF